MFRTRNAWASLPGYPLNEVYWGFSRPRKDNLNSGVNSTMVYVYILPPIFELAVGVVKINLDEQTEHRRTSWIANLLSKILRHEVNYDFQFTEDDNKCRFICVAIVRKRFSFTYRYRIPYISLHVQIYYKNFPLLPSKFNKYHCVYKSMQYFHFVIFLVPSKIRKRNGSRCIRFLSLWKLNNSYWSATGV
jgi:hypothetical protein